ncbi:hypothetical protein BASA83_007489 [Batrachochytrium salamandrivorans]|nr:hypothetical protein BASA83_007489 [Batrachochytrium salamandrivorans]
MTYSKNAAYAVLHHVAIVTHLLRWVDTPAELGAVSKEASQALRDTEWVIFWLKNHPMKLHVWAETFMRGYIAPSTQADWFVAVSASIKPKTSLWLIQQAMWVLCAFTGALDSMAQILIQQQKEPSSTSCHRNADNTVCVTLSLDLLKPAAFAAIQHAASNNTGASEYSDLMYPRSNSYAKDLHYFAMRVGHVASVRFLIETHGYIIGPHVVYLLNHAQQNKNMALVELLVELQAIFKRGYRGD